MLLGLCLDASVHSDSDKHDNCGGIFEESASDTENELEIYIKAHSMSLLIGSLMKSV